MNEKKKSPMEIAAECVPVPPCPKCGGKGRFLQRELPQEYSTAIVCACSCGHRTQEYILREGRDGVGDFMNAMDLAVEEFGRCLI